MLDDKYDVHENDDNDDDVSECSLFNTNKSLKYTKVSH